MTAILFFEISMFNKELSPRLARNKEFDIPSYNGIRIPDAASDTNDAIGRSNLRVSRA